MGDLFGKITNLLGGSVFKEVKELAMAYFPPDMSPEKKLEFELKSTELANQRLRDIDAAIASAEKDLNDRIALTEGTASDLKAMPVLGPIMLFLRGSQRPTWGFATMYIDYMVFSKEWVITDPAISSAFWMINVLVLGFLFGERAMKNVMPSLAPFLQKIIKS